MIRVVGLAAPEREHALRDGVAVDCAAAGERVRTCLPVYEGRARGMHALRTFRGAGYGKAVRAPGSSVRPVKTTRVDGPGSHRFARSVVDWRRREGRTVHGSRALRRVNDPHLDKHREEVVRHVALSERSRDRQRDKRRNEGHHHRPIVDLPIDFRYLCSPGGR